MLFKSFCTDVHFNVFIYYIIVLTKLRLCIVTKIQPFKDFNFLIKICRIGLHLTLLFTYITLSKVEIISFYALLFFVFHYMNVYI